MRTYLFVLCALLSAPAAAEIYKSIDAQGNVVYSDQPSPGAETVDLPEPSVYSPPPVAPRISSSDLDTDDQTDAGPAYSRLVVLEPADQQSIRANDGVVSVKLGISPGLAQGHQIEFLIDGVVVSRGTTLQAELTEVARGQHSLRARIVSSEGDALITSSAITFFVQKFSSLTSPASALTPVDGAGFDLPPVTKAPQAPRAPTLR